MKQDILNIDATPDESYPLRILKVYRALCDARFSSTTDADKGEPSALIVQMNKWQEQRAALLDKAIEILQER